MTRPGRTKRFLFVHYNIVVVNTSFHFPINNRPVKFKSNEERHRKRLQLFSRFFMHSSAMFENGLCQVVVIQNRVSSP